MTNKMPEVGAKYRSKKDGREIEILKVDSEYVYFGPYGGMSHSNFHIIFEPLQTEESKVQNQPQAQVKEGDNFRLNKILNRIQALGQADPGCNVRAIDTEFRKNETFETESNMQKLHIAKVEEAKEELKHHLYLFGNVENYYGNIPENDFESRISMVADSSEELIFSLQKQVKELAERVNKLEGRNEF